MGEEKKIPLKYEHFIKQLNESNISVSPYRNRTNFGKNYYDNFTLDEIRSILSAGDIEEIKELSRYYYRTNGIYSRAIAYLATLLLYDYVLIPLYDPDKKDENKIKKKFSSALKFLENLNVQTTFTRVTLQTLVNGIYYGILQEENGKYTLQDLPPEYCRTRLKDINDLDIIEFNMAFFMKIQDIDLQISTISGYPIEIQEAYQNYLEGNTKDTWTIITPQQGGFCFFFGEKIPLLINSLPDLIELNHAKDREAKRDENELIKIVIQKMLVNKNDDLVFELPEAAQIHKNVVDMLSNNPTLDVITSPFDIKLESLQDATAATQSSDRIEKYEKTTYDSMGISSTIFNSEKADELKYSIQKDISLMLSWAKKYEVWLNTQLNYRYSSSNLRFNVTILATSIHTRDEIYKQYMNSAQFGLPVSYTAASLGIGQSSLISLVDFETNILELQSKMVPLQSSYTTSGEILQEEKTKKSNNNIQNITSDNNNNDINDSGNAETGGEEVDEAKNSN